MCCHVPAVMVPLALSSCTIWHSPLPANSAGLCCRDHMTDVVVKNLTTDEQLRIECKDYVKKLAVYKQRLAIQVPKQVTAYELQPDSNGDRMRYKPIAIIQQSLDCNLLVVTALHIILCQVSAPCDVYYTSQQAYMHAAPCSGSISCQGGSSSCCQEVRASRIKLSASPVRCSVVRHITI